MVKITTDPENTEGDVLALSPKMAKVYAEAGNKFDSRAWPGGYTLIYLDLDNNVLCAECAAKPGYSTAVVDYDIYYEGPTLQCDNCNADIESSYGDPEEDNDDVN